MPPWLVWGLKKGIITLFQYKITWTLDCFSQWWQYFEMIWGANTPVCFGAGNPMFLFISWCLKVLSSLGEDAVWRIASQCIWRDTQPTQLSVLSKKAQPPNTEKTCSYHFVHLFYQICRDEKCFHLKSCFAVSYWVRRCELEKVLPPEKKLRGIAIQTCCKPKISIKNWKLHIKMDLPVKFGPPIHKTQLEGAPWK